ncbi:MAG: hypothetical protein BRD50_04965 [Bacteroidetes bacterium SW_11_45_7]|nr:MAG: hypothetical protein BRD50_04965 [Bacteroidetes bacterium SW_11_45_7]
MRGEGRLCHGELRNGDGAEAAMPLKGIDHAEKFKKPFLKGVHHKNAYLIIPRLRRGEAR